MTLCLKNSDVLHVTPNRAPTVELSTTITFELAPTEVAVTARVVEPAATVKKPEVDVPQAPVADAHCDVVPKRVAVAVGVAVPIMIAEPDTASATGKFETATFVL